MENTSDATTQDFISQRQNLDEIITPIIQKLNEPGTNKIKTLKIIQIKSIAFKLLFFMYGINYTLFVYCVNTMFLNILTVETVSIKLVCAHVCSPFVHPE